MPLLQYMISESFFCLYDPFGQKEPKMQRNFQLFIDGGYEIWYTIHIF